MPCGRNVVEITRLTGGLNEGKWAGRPRVTGLTYNGLRSLTQPSSKIPFQGLRYTSGAWQHSSARANSLAARGML